MTRKISYSSKGCSATVVFLLLFLTTLSGKVFSNTSDTKDYALIYEEALENVTKDPQKSFAQALTVVESSTGPILKAKALNILGLIFKKQEKYQESLVYHTQAYDLSQAENEVEISIDALLKIADVHRFTKDFDRGLADILKAEVLAKQHNLYASLVDVYLAQAKVNKNAKRNEKSLNSLFRAIDVVEQHGFDALKSELYFKVSFIYKRLEQLEMAIEYNIKAINIEEQYEDVDHSKLVKYLNELSEYSRKLGDLKSALEYALRCLSLLPEIDAPKLEQRMLLNLTNIYRRLTVYDTALEYAVKLRESYEAQDNLSGVASANIQIALVYDHLEQYKISQEFYQKALDIPMQAAGMRHHASAYRGKANISRKIGNYKESLIFAEKARDISEQVNYKRGVESSNRLIAQIYTALGDTQTALATFKVALKQAKRLSDSWAEARSLIFIGDLLVPDQPELALTYVEDGMGIADKNGAKGLVLDAYEAMMQIAYKQENYKEAYEYSLLVMDLSDEIHLGEMAKRVAHLKIVKEVYEKEQKIEILKRTSRLNQLEIDMQSAKLNLLDKENEISNLKLAKEQSVQVYMLVVLLLAIVLLSGLYLRFRFSKKIHTNDSDA